MNLLRRNAWPLLATVLVSVGCSREPAGEPAPKLSNGGAACPSTPEEAGAAVRQLVAEFRESFERDVRVPEWCFASEDDYAEVADRLERVCRERPVEARADALALVALKAGRCAGFEAGRRSTLGDGRRGPRFGQR